MTPDVAAAAGVSLTGELSKEDGDKLVKAKMDARAESSEKNRSKNTSLTVSSSSSLRKEIYEKLMEERNRPSSVKAGMNVISSANFSERDDYSFPVMKIVGISRDGKKVTIEPTKLTTEQKEYKAKNPSAYKEKVDVGSIFNVGAGVAIKDLQRIAYMENTGNIPPSVKNRTYASQIASSQSQWEKLSRELYRGNKKGKKATDQV